MHLYAISKPKKAVQNKTVLPFKIIPKQNQHYRNWSTVNQPYKYKPKVFAFRYIPD